MSEELKNRIEETVAYLNARKTINPKIAIVLGSGLGGLTKTIDIIDEIPFFACRHPDARYLCQLW